MSAISHSTPCAAPIAQRAATRPWLALAAGLLLTGSAWAQVPLSLTTDEGPVARYHPQLTPEQKKQLRKNLANGVTIPYWTQQVTSPKTGLTYPMTMVGHSSPFDKNPNNKPVQYLPIALKIRVKTDTGVVVQDPMSPPCGGTVSAMDLMMQSPMFTTIPATINGVDVTKNVGGAAQLSTIFQRANFWGQLTKNNPLGNHWQVRLQSSVKAPVVEEIELPGTSRVYTCEGGTGTSARVKIAEFEPMVYEILKKYAAPNQIVFIIPYNVVFWTRDQKSIAFGYHNAVPIGNDVQTYAVSSFFDSVSYTHNFHLNDVESMVHEYVELLNDPFTSNIAPPFPSVNRTPGWRTPENKCQTNLEPGDVVSWYNTKPYEVTASNGYAYHFRDQVFYQWFYRLPSTAAGGKYSMMGSVSNYQDTICQ